jgi:hypothetical protein
MKRTQIQIDERTYGALRRRAFREGRSISAVVRECLAVSLGLASGRRKTTIKDFTFIGAGRSRQEKLSPIPERHDEALVDILLKERRR